MTTVNETPLPDPQAHRPRTWPGCTAAAAALGYAAPHFWWGAGIGAMFPGDSPEPRRATWRPRSATG